MTRNRLPTIVGGAGKRWSMLWAELMSSAPNAYVEALPLLPQNMTEFGDRVFKEIIKIK